MAHPVEPVQGGRLPCAGTVYWMYPRLRRSSASSGVLAIRSSGRSVPKGFLLLEEGHPSRAQAPDDLALGQR